jgi:hypothetical protein
MEDLLKDLAAAKPPTPEVDPARMERDLARILALPRHRVARLQLVKRFTPLLVAAAVIALVVVLLPQPTRPVQPASPPQWWHQLTRQWSLMVVGGPANPYLVQFEAMTDAWLSANSQITVVQKDGQVVPYSHDDEAKWEAAGKPAVAPQLGGNHAVRIGPMKPAVQKTNVAGFQMSAHSQVRFDALSSLPADPQELKKALEAIIGPNSPQAERPYRTASLAMGLMAANVSSDQRRAAFELLKTLDGARFLGEVPLRDGRFGIGVGIAAPPTFQFSGVETQLVVSPETGLPMVRREMLTTPQHGLPAGVGIAEEEYLLLDRTDIDPIVPLDVPVNGEVDSPIVAR